MPKGINRLALFETFSKVGDRCADADGFVPAHALLDYFGADIVMRPMLVEGAIAYVPGGRWRIYIDSERYPDISAKSLKTEKAGASLPPRLRFTIGHELSHISALSTSGDNLDLRFDPAAGETSTQLEKALEKLTDDLTTLLLVPERALRQQLMQSVGTTDSIRWSNIRHHFGVSRPALIHRLIRLQEYDPTDLRQHEGIRNRALLLARWGDYGHADLLPYPVYYSFDEGLAPDALLHLVLRGESRMPSVLALSGGSLSEHSEESIFSVSPNARGQKASLNWSVEHLNVPKPGHSSLVVLRRDP